MATSTKAKSAGNKNGGYSNYSSVNNVDVANDTKSDSLALVLIVILLIVVLVMIPLIAWMYTDVRRLEIQVEKALVRLNK